MSDEIIESTILSLIKRKSISKLETFELYIYESTAHVY